MLVDSALVSSLSLCSRELLLLMFPNIPELVRLVRAVADLASLVKVVAGRRRGGAPIITFSTFLIHLSFCQQMGVRVSSWSTGGGKQAVLLQALTRQNASSMRIV